MADPKIVEYVQTSLSQGVSVEEIRAALAQQGWSEYDIEEALSTPGQAQPAAGTAMQGKAGSGGFDIKAIMTASENEYSPEFVYKILIEVAIFSIASIALIFIGLPWYVPIIVIGIIGGLAFMQINKLKQKSAAPDQM